MKIINNKNIFILLIVLVLGVLGALSYHTFISYVKYTTTQTSTKNIVFIETLDRALKLITQERLNSAIYMGTEGKTGFDKVKKLRVDVDSAISNIHVFIANNNAYSSYIKRLQYVEENLKYARTKVDTLSSDYMNIFYEVYHIQIFESLKGGMKIIASKESASEMKAYLSTYIDFISLRENVQLENTGIIFILSGAKKMSNDDLQMWDSLLANITLPNFSTLKNRALVTQLNSLMSAEEFANIGTEVRIRILYGSIYGKYPVETNEWFSQIEKKIQYIGDAQGVLMPNIQKYIDHNVSTSRGIMTEYMYGALFTLILLLVLLVIYYNINKDKQLFEDTLKDIESVLNIEQQKELKFLIDNRKTNQIYKFLTSTIREANETKDLFLANMSHEIRTPLNGIVGFTQLLKSTGTNAEQEEFISVIEHSSENLLTIVNDILDFSKIRANQIELEQIPFDPMDRFESDIESYGARAAEKDIKLGVYIDPSLPISLLGDPTKVSQILVNLLSNAIKFTDMNGNVDISIRKVEETLNDMTVKFLVQDTGIGISDEQKNKIFNEFSQADASTSRKFGGTGLGLAIASKFVSVMGGKLEIISEKGKGSTFYFTLKFKKNEDSLLRTKVDKHGIKVGYLVPDKNIERAMNVSVQEYVEYTNASFTIYEGSELLSLDKLILPDILFINHQYCKFDNELEKYLELDTKIVLITTGRLKSKILNVEENIDRIMYQPINFSKILKSFDVLTQNTLLNNKDTKNNKKENILFEGIHALVAEDNNINQKLIQNILERMGVKVTVANNGEEAFSYRKTHAYNIIFMDIQMPVMGGIEATKAILRFEKENNMKHIPIVALTANALTGDREKYINAGMDSYLSKPLELEKLSLLLAEYFPERILGKESTDVKKIQEVELPEDIVNDKINNIIEARHIENVEPKRKVDILLYHPLKLMANIYKCILEKLEYDVEIVTDGNALLDNMEATDYRFIVYVTESLDGMECMIADIIKDSGAIPYMLVGKEKSAGQGCSDNIHVETDFREIVEKLKLNQ